MVEEEHWRPKSSDSYNHLYTTIHQELVTLLEQSKFSNAPAIINQANMVLDDLNKLYLIPELSGKATALVTSHYTNELFRLGILNQWFVRVG